MSKVVNFGSCWDKEVECEMPSSSQDAWWGYITAKKKIPLLLSVFLLSIPHFFPWTSLHVIKSLVMEQHCHLVAL